MNRRDFIKQTLAGVIGISSIAAVNLEKVIDETSHMSDVEFEYYITTYINLYVDNPRYCVVITNIAE